MATTSHGHHIPGTLTSTDDNSLGKARCGGPNHCRVCKEEASTVTVDFLSPEVHVKKFWRKPIEVEAVHWIEGIAMNVLISFTDHLVRLDDVNRVFYVFEIRQNKWTQFHYGDWIIKGPQGEFFPCSHEDFIATYEN